MLPPTVRLELFMANAATNAAPGATITLPVTTAGPPFTKHTPVTRTDE
jgi:hypothetical protein